MARSFEGATAPENFRAGTSFERKGTETQRVKLPALQAAMSSENQGRGGWEKSNPKTLDCEYNSLASAIRPIFVDPRLSPAGSKSTKCNSSVTIQSTLDNATRQC